jgi:GT2 family glycosyltransferase
LAAKARNLGIQNASGEIVAFTDDDCQPDPDWLENARKYFEDNRVAGIEGDIYTDEDKINDPKFRIVTNRGIQGMGFMTANLFVRLNILKIIGGFDERFDKPHFREDTDLAWRVLDYGNIPFAKDVHVYHPPIPRKEKGESKQDRDRFFVNDALLFQKHPEKYIKLMKIENHYKYNNNFWRFFLEGIKQIEGQIPVELLLNDSEINKYVSNELKKQVI